VALFVYDDVKENIVLILSLSFVVPLILFFSLGFYWIFQMVIIDNEGVKILFCKKIIKECSWDKIENIEEANIMKNPALRIRIAGGSELHLDKRKRIISAIEFYSKKPYSKITK
jgi:hypothetical protein